MMSATTEGRAALLALRGGKAAGSMVMPAAAPATGGFDLDAWHAMDQRDNALIADEIMHGSLSGKFTYSFPLQGSNVVGVSVVGARHLAAHYGGLKHRILASTEKRGRQFIFTTYPQEGIPMGVHVAVIDELEGEPDYYKVLVEITDVKKGISEQHEKTEMRFEKKRDGSQFERPHLQNIAQAKAFRNAVLAIVPQDVIEKFKQQCLQLGKNAEVTGNVIEEKRAAILRYATGKGIGINRQALAGLTFDQIGGLSDAARNGLDAFRQSLSSLRVAASELREVEYVDAETGEVAPTQPSKAAEQAPANDAPAAPPAPSPETFGNELPPQDDGFPKDVAAQIDAAAARNAARARKTEG